MIAPTSTFDSTLPEHFRNNLPQIVPQKHIQAPEGGDLRVVGGGEEDGGLVAVEVLAAHIVGVVQQQEAPGGDLGAVFVDGVTLCSILGGVDAPVEMPVQLPPVRGRHSAPGGAHVVQLPVDLLQLLGGEAPEAGFHHAEIGLVFFVAVSPGADLPARAQKPQQVADAGGVAGLAGVRPGGHIIIVGVHSRPVAGEFFGLIPLSRARQEGEEAGIPGIVVGLGLGTVQHRAQKLLLPPFFGELQLLAAEHGVEEGKIGRIVVVCGGLAVALHGDGLDPQPGVHGHGMEQIHFPQTVLDQLALEEFRVVDVLFRGHGKTKLGAVLAAGQCAGGAAVFVIEGDAVFRRTVDGDGVQMLCHLGSLRFLFWEDYTI